MAHIGVVRLLAWGAGMRLLLGLGMCLDLFGLGLLGGLSLLGRGILLLAGRRPLAMVTVIAAAVSVGASAPLRASAMCALAGAFVAAFGRGRRAGPWD